MKYLVNYLVFVFFFANPNIKAELKFIENDGEEFHVYNVSEFPSFMQLEEQSGYLVKLRCPIRGHKNNTKYRWFKGSNILKGYLRDNGENVSFVFFPKKTC